MGGHHRGRHAIALHTVSTHPAKGRSTVTSGSPTPGRHRAPARVLTLDEFNAADEATAAEVLGACLDVQEWVFEVAAARPYVDLDALRAAGLHRSSGIAWEQVAGALGRHPRIGEKAAAVAGTGTEKAWSSSEQSGVLPTHTALIAAGNAAYEERFGYIFLICASGLTGSEILSHLNHRLTNDPESEKLVVTEELRKIAALRLAKAVSG